MLCLIYTHSPKGECVYIRQSTSACLITNMLHFQHYKISPNLKSTARLAYIVTNTDTDCGDILNVFITLPNVSMMFPIAFISIMGLYSHSHGICFKVFIAVSGKEFR